jgi:hypothetical protein
MGQLRASDRCGTVLRIVEHSREARASQVLGLGLGRVFLSSEADYRYRTIVGFTEHGIHGAYLSASSV